MINIKYSIGTILIRRKKSNIRCGDMFVVVESAPSGNWYRLLSLRKNGHFALTPVNYDTIDKLYVVIGHTKSIDGLLELCRGLNLE